MLIYGLARNYSSNDVTIYVDAHGYGTKSSGNIHTAPCYQWRFQEHFSDIASSLWNELPTEVKTNM